MTKCALLKKKINGIVGESVRGFVEQLLAFLRLAGIHFG